MTMTEVQLVFDYWKDYPPTNEVTAAVNGVGVFGRKPEERGSEEGAQAVDPKTIEELRASLARNAHLLLKG